MSASRCLNDLFAEELEYRPSSPEPRKISSFPQAPRRCAASLGQHAAPRAREIRVGDDPLWRRRRGRVVPRRRGVMQALAYRGYRYARDEPLDELLIGAGREQALNASRSTPTFVGYRAHGSPSAAGRSLARSRRSPPTLADAGRRRAVALPSDLQLALGQHVQPSPRSLLEDRRPARSIHAAPPASGRFQRTMSGGSIRSRSSRGDAQLLSKPGSFMNRSCARPTREERQLDAGTPRPPPAAAERAPLAERRESRISRRRSPRSAARCFAPGRPPPRRMLSGRRDTPPSRVAGRLRSRRAHTPV